LLIGERVDLRVDRAETVRELVRLLKSWHDESDEAEQIAAQRNEVFVRKPLSGSRVGFVSSGDGNIQMKILPFEISDETIENIKSEAELE
jgi:hypothetical protein